MEAKEFRIGNLVTVSGSHDIVSIASIARVWFQPKFMDKAWTRRLVSDIVPIQLTEEILLKCKGVSKASLRPEYDHDNENPNYDEGYYSKSYDLIGVDLCGFNVFKCELCNNCYQLVGIKERKLYFVDDVLASDESMYLSNTSVGLSFLHEFQNAFPFFTGEELQINI